VKKNPFVLCPLRKKGEKKKSIICQIEKKGKDIMGTRTSLKEGKKNYSDVEIRISFGSNRMLNTCFSLTLYHIHQN